MIILNVSPQMVGRSQVSGNNYVLRFILNIAVLMGVIFAFAVAVGDAQAQAGSVISPSVQK
jgi:hypothetical protein